MPEKKPRMTMLTPTQLQEVTGKSYPTIRKRIANLMPVHEDGNTRYYNAQEAIAAIMLADDGRGMSLDLQKERARLAKEQADKTAMENAEKRGDLVSSRKMAEAWANVLTTVKTKFLSVPTKAAPLVMGCQSLPEVKAVLEELIHECLSELSGTPPGTLAGDSSAEGAETAAETDGVEVGGRASKTKSGKQRRTRKVAN